jgi:gliding motility-associated-like protein
MLKILMKFTTTLILFFFALGIGWGQMVTNGDMEQGLTGLNTLPTAWNIISGTPDYCDSSPATCQTLPYKIQNPSPQGGRWIRFFNGVLIPGPNNEIFGQTLTSPLVVDQEYSISFYAAYSRINDDVNATTANIIFGFSNGMPAGQVGLNNRDTIPLNVPEEWIFHSFSFVPQTDMDYVSFGKLEEDLFNACYIDDVKIIPVCQVDLGPDTTVCIGDTYLLDVETNNGEYLWQDGSTSPTYNVTEPGTYWVEVSANLCTSRDTVVIDFVPGPEVTLEPEINVCVGDTLLLDVTDQGASYLWQDGSTSPVYEVTTENYYEVIVTLGNCSITEGTEVIYNEPPVVDLGPDTSICDSYFLRLDPQVADAAYKWQDGSTTNTFLVRQPGTYSVDVLRFGCLVSDTIQVGLRELYCDCFLSFPNVFSPNNDGVNDEFEVFNTCPLAEYSFSVYNRWGVQLYESRTPGVFWDGTFRGQAAEIGVYTYMVRYQFQDRAQTETRTGSFTLIR